VSHEPASRRAALAFASASFGLVAPLAYVGQRLFEVARSPIPVDPVLIVRDAHTAFYWRAATAAWWAALIAAMVYAAVRRRGNDSRLERALTVAAVPMVVVLGALAWWFP
jgi:hypothetical protein